MTKQMCDQFGYLCFGEVGSVADGMWWLAMVVGVWTSNGG
jgi:hypothetical protein